MHLARIRPGLWLLLPIALAWIGCGSGGSSGHSGGLPAGNLNFLGGQQLPGNRPDPTANPNAPVITDTNYYPIVRQGGTLTGVLTFKDDHYAGVTTMIFQIEGADQHFTFTVSPLQDPLNPDMTTVNFTVALDPGFLPGTFTLYMGLADEDGNVSAFLPRLLVVKAAADLAIAELRPAEGAVNVGANTVIQARFSQQVFPGEARITLRSNGTEVPGAERLAPNGRTLYFTPDQLLLPGAGYDITASILVNGKSMSAHFTTSNPPPLPDPARLEGMVFGVLIGKDNLVEPEEGKAIFDLLLGGMPPILSKVVAFDPATGAMSVVGGMGQSDGAGGWVQSAMVPAFGPGPGQLANPWFATGPSEMVIPLAALGLPGQVSLHELTLEGHYTADAAGAVTGLEQGAITGRLDSREINAVLLELTHRPMDLCQLMPLCDAAGTIIFRAENIHGDVIAGIDHLDGIHCEPTPASVNAAAGGALRLACTTTRDGAGFQGNDLTFFAKAGTGGAEHQVGAWDYLGAACAGTPPVCPVPDASGRVEVQVTVAPGELTPGDPSFRVGASYNSSAGSMTGAAAVAVE